MNRGCFGVRSHAIDLIEVIFDERATSNVRNDRTFDVLANASSFRRKKGRQK